MTDHAQREALIAEAQGYAAEMASRADDAGRGGRIITQLLAALRASAPPAQEGDKGLAEGDLCPRCPPSKMLGDGTHVVCTACGYEAPRTARTAIGEPPTGMREVPGTPGLYEPGEDPMKAGVWPEHCEQRAFVAGAAWWEFNESGGTMWASDRDLAEAEAVKRYGEPSVSPLDLDALALETGKAAARVMSCNSHRVCDLTPEAIAIIRAALDRVKEAK